MEWDDNDESSTFHPSESLSSPEPPNDDGTKDGEEICFSPMSSRPPLIPPHWSHKRHVSYISIDGGLPAHSPIVLEDNTGEQSERSNSCWARAVTINDYVLVSGNKVGAGTFVVFNCRVDTLDVSHTYHGPPDNEGVGSFQSREEGGDFGMLLHGFGLIESHRAHHF